MNILFAAGTQFPFPRLDEVVLRVGRERPGWSLVYQAGPGARLAPLQSVANLLVQPFFEGECYQRLFAEADLVVTHAGMGNILACLEVGKPFLMLPRRVGLREHRNDHQQDTAEAIASLYGVAFHEEVGSLTQAILGYDMRPLSGEPLDEVIRDRRREFGKHLNALIRSL